MTTVKIRLLRARAGDTFDNSDVAAKRRLLATLSKSIEGFDVFPDP